MGMSLPVHVVSELLTNVSRFPGQVLLQILLFAPQGLDLIMVKAELFSEGFAGLLEPVDFAFKCSVEGVGVGDLRV